MYSFASEGQPLVEVFGVRFLPSGEAPAGTVSVFDGKRGQIIYSVCGTVDEPSSIEVKQIPGGRLPLTGPYRAISADGCVAIIQDLDHLRLRHSCTVGGTVVARTDLGEVVLFHDNGASVGKENEPDAVPLARSVVAVPLTSSLTVQVDLVVGDGDGEEAVNDSVVCRPKIGREDVQRRPAAGVATVEVKLTWLD